MPFGYDEIAARIDSVFNPEPVIGSEGEEWYEAPPSPRLKAEYRLDTTYWKPFEFGSTSPLVGHAAINDADLAGVVQAQQVPRELFTGTLRLFGDSILAYHGRAGRAGPYRFYPAILMSAWASFEAFVRIYSELLVKTVSNLPPSVCHQLLEREEFLDDQGKLRTQSKMQPVLRRYWWLLKFGFNLAYDRGGRIWQAGEKALDRRNELVHYEVAGMPSLNSIELRQHLEAILLLLIGPSCQIKRSIMPDQFELYGMLEALRPFVEEYEERPFFKDLPVNLREVIFACPFENVDSRKVTTGGSRKGRNST